MTTQTPTIGPLTIDGLQATGLRQIPEAAGIYLWIRGLQLDPECAIKPTLFSAALEDVVRLPYIQSKRLHLRAASDARPTTMRNRLVHFSRFTIGGGRLSEAKKAHLQRIANNRAERLALYRLLPDSIGRFGPVLYVGETQDLRNRIRTHMSGGTDFLGLARTTGIPQNHLILYYLPLPHFSDQTRTLVEQVLTHLLVAPLTRRPG